MSKKDILRKEYYKNRTRIQRFVRSAEKRGYTFDVGIIPEIPKNITEGSVRRLEKITPKSLYKRSSFSYTTQEGHTVTLKGKQPKAIENEFLEKTNSDLEETKTNEVKHPVKKEESVQPHTRFYNESDYEEGEGNEADEVDDGLATLRELIDSWAPSANWTESLTASKQADQHVAKNVLYAAIAELGEKQVVKNVQSHGEELKDLLNHVLYDSGSREGNFKDGRTQVNADIKRFQELLLGHTLSQQEAMKTQELIERLHHFEEV